MTFIALVDGLELFVTHVWNSTVCSHTCLYASPSISIKRVLDKLFSQFLLKINITYG